MKNNQMVLLLAGWRVRAAGPKQEAVTIRHLGEVHFPTDFHQVVVRINLLPVEAKLLELQHKLIAIQNKLEETPSLDKEEFNSTTSECLSEVKRTGRRVKDLLDYHDTRNSHVPKRGRRGAFNFIGSGASYLFGLATEDQVEKNSMRANDISEVVEAMARYQTDQVTVLRSLGYEHEAIHKDLETAVKRLNELSEGEIKLKLATTILQTEVYLNRVNSRLNTLSTALAEVLVGKVPNELLAASHWAAIHEERQRLGAEPSAPYSDAEHLLLNSAFGTAVMGIPMIRGYITFSVVLPSELLPYDMQLYEISPQIVWNSTLETGVHYVISNRFIAATNDLTTFILIPDMAICKGVGNHFLCPNPDEILTKNSQRCEISLYLRDFKKARLFCDRTILPRDFPMFERKSKTYKFFVPSPLTLSLSCENKDEVKSENLQGIGTIVIPKSCKGHVDGGIILTPSIISPRITTEFNITILDEEKPSIVLDDEEIELLTTSKEELHLSLRSDPESRKLNELIGKLRKFKQFRWMPIEPKHHSIMTIIVVVVTISVGIGVSVRKCYRFRRQRRARPEEIDLVQPPIRDPEPEIPDDFAEFRSNSSQRSRRLRIGSQNEN